MTMRTALLVAVVAAMTTPASARGALPTDTEVATFAVNAGQAVFDYRGPRDRSDWKRRNAKVMTPRGVRGWDRALRRSGNYHHRLSATGVTDGDRTAPMGAAAGPGKATVEAVSAGEWIVRTGIAMRAVLPGYPRSLTTVRMDLTTRVVRTPHGLRLAQVLAKEHR